MQDFHVGKVPNFIFDLYISKLYPSNRHKAIVCHSKGKSQHPNRHSIFAYTIIVLRHGRLEEAMKSATVSVRVKNDEKNHVSNEYQCHVYLGGCIL